MKAVVFHEHGGVDKLRYEEVETPEPSHGEVVVKVKACALNHLDIWERKGLPNVRIPLPHISGSDISGEVASLGEGVTGMGVGDRVVVAPGLNCGKCEHCLAGEDSLCRSYTIIGYLVNGGYAEYVKVPAANILPMPKRLSVEEAAAVPLVFLTAWHMLVTKARIKPGDDVLVLAAGSGVGTATIQVAKLFNARVIATAGSDAKLKKAREIGADEVINHYEKDFSEEARRLTGRRGVDIVVEHVGEATWNKSIRSLAPSGRMVTCGGTSGYQGQSDIRYIYNRQLSILGSYMGSKRELVEVLKFVDAGKLRPVVDKIYPLEQAAEAQSRMEKSEHFGKIILTTP